MTAASTAAARARVTSRLRSPGARRCLPPRASRPDRPRRLHQHRVTGPHDAAPAGRRGLVAVGDEVPLDARAGAVQVAAAGSPDGDQHVEAERGRASRRRSRCSSAAAGPSSAISPSTAMRRPAPGRSARRARAASSEDGVGVVGVVDGHAAAGQRVVLRRHALQADRRRGRRAHDVEVEQPSARQTAIAAARLSALWRPVRFVSTAIVRAVDVERAPSWPPGSAAAAGERTSAPASSPKVTQHRPVAQVRLEQRLAGRHHRQPSTCSARAARPWRRRSPRGEPSSSRCASPTFVMTPIVGARERARARRSARARASPSRRRRPRCRRRSRQSVNGRPISSLWLAAAAIVRRSGAEQRRQHVLGRRLAGGAGDADHGGGRRRPGWRRRWSAAQRSCRARPARRRPARRPRAASSTSTAAQPCARASAVMVVAAADGDEQARPAGAPRVHLDAVDRRRGGAPHDPCSRAAPRGGRDHARAPPARPARSSNGIFDARRAPGPARGPCRR